METIAGALAGAGELAHMVFGPDGEPASLSLPQMAARALVVFGASLVIVRLGGKRFLGRHTPADVLLGIVVGSVMSRAINGSAPLLPTLGTGFVLLGLHWLVSTAAFHWDGVSGLLKGRPRPLIRDGELLRDHLRASNVGEEDLREALRANAQTEHFEDVRLATLERNGDITVIRRDDPARGGAGRPKSGDERESG
jgi:uncharacterized membrane protein YcaP (DUF421 family)